MENLPEITPDIDMEVSGYDDDDDFMPMMKSESKVLEGSDGRNLAPEKTGIILDFSDDDSPRKPIKTIRADIDENNNLRISGSNRNTFDDPYAGIDMEIDDEFTDDFYDEDEILLEKEFIDEDILTEIKKKPTITPKQAESNYLDKLAKKNASTIKKGTMPPYPHWHTEGNHEIEKAEFHKGTITTSDGGTSIGVASTPASAAASGGDCGGGVIAETRNNKSRVKPIDEALMIIGFDVAEQDNNCYSACDLCDPDNTVSCSNKQELYDKLLPYIEDCFIIPLQISTGEKFNNCSDWCNWYTEANQRRFPKCASDIEYCKALAKYFGD